MTYVATLRGLDYLFCDEYCLGQWVADLTPDEQQEVATGPIEAQPGNCAYADEDFAS